MCALQRLDPGATSRYHSGRMDDRTLIEQVAQAITTAIAAKDDRALVENLTPDFVLRRPGAEAMTLAKFIAAVRDQPLEVMSVQLENVEIDVTGDAAIATGIQTSQVRVDDETVHDRQPFVDWFVKINGRWQLRAALDFSDW